MFAPIRQKLARFFIRDDSEYAGFVERYQARTAAQKTLYLFLHIVPGILGYIGIYYLREPIMAWTGLSSKDTQWSLVFVIGIGWLIIVPVVWLLKVDGLSFREVWHFLGFAKLDWRGILLVMPVVTLLALIPSTPFVLWVYPGLYNLLNAVPVLHIPDWHISYQFYAFPLPQLIISLVANYLGEEIYWRGFLLKKIGFLGGWSWVVSNALFELNHIYQAPNNWPYILLAWILPFGLIMYWRKSIYPAIAFHVAVNHVVPLLFALF